MYNAPNYLPSWVHYSKEKCKYSHIDFGMIPQKLYNRYFFKKKLQLWKATLEKNFEKQLHI